MTSERFVTTADYNGTLTGRIANDWRDWSTDKHRIIGYTVAIIAALLHKPSLCLAAALLTGTVVATGSWGLAIGVTIPLYLAWVGRHLAGLLVGAPRRLRLSEILPTVSMFVRSRRAWRVACLAQGVKQPGRGGSLPALYSWSVTQSGVSALVDLGTYGKTVAEVAPLADRITAAAIGPRIGRAITVQVQRLPQSWVLPRVLVDSLFLPPARGAAVMEEYGPGIGKLYISYIDPLEEVVPVTALVRAPAPLLSIGPTEHGDPAFIHRGMHMMVGGLTGSGKSNFIHTITASALYDGEPFQVWGVDPVGGVELYELGRARDAGSPIAKEYASSDAEIRVLVQKLFNEFERRMRLIRGTDRFITPSEEFPRIYVFFDDYMNGRHALLSKVTAKGPTYESLFIQLLTGARRAAITVAIMTHIPFGHSVGEQIRSLFPQHVAFRLNDQFATNSMFGAQSEIMGARASRIKMSTPGVGYVAMDQWPAPVRFRNPLMTRELVSLIYQGLLPDGLVLAEASPESSVPLAQWQNREHVLYRWDHPDGACLYVGISVDGLRRADEHLSDPNKRRLHSAGVQQTIVHVFDADSCADQIAAGRTVKQVAESVEAEMIQRLQPELNIAHAGSGRRRKALTRA